jgi:hypothetical protein
VSQYHVYITEGAAALISPEEGRVLAGRIAGLYEDNLPSEADTFKGFMPADDLLRAERLGSLDHGPTYIAEQGELVPFVLPVVEG